MQYRLSTIFLVFFFVAATLALFGAWGIWIAAVLGVAAICFNKAKTTTDGAVRVFFVILIGVVCPGVLWPQRSVAREAARRAQCLNNLKQIGFALLNYENTYGHCPAVNTCDKTGKPLYSWLVNILPELDRRDIYDAISKDEPWDSPNNAMALNKVKIKMFDCPSVVKTPADFSSSYIAIIGPGTIWRKEGPVKLADLSDPSLTVMAIECVESDKHWAEPYTLTAEESLERMKTGKGMRISSAHPGGVNVLFADGHTDCLSVDTPISLWRKLLMGELKSQGELHSWKEDPNDPPAVNLSRYKAQAKPSEWAFVLSVIVWLISVGLLFYRAWDSREMPVKP